MNFKNIFNSIKSIFIKKDKSKFMPKLTLLTIPSEEKSARKLGIPLQTYYNGHVEDLSDSVVIRYGYGHDIDSRDSIFGDLDDFRYVLNNKHAIQLNVDKIKSHEVLSKVVNTPKFYLDEVPKGKTVVKRYKNHAAGANFEIVKGPFKIPEGFYCSEFVDTKTEVRVFICGDKTLTCSRALLKNGLDNNHELCRSNWSYVRFRKTPVRLHKIALKCAKAIGLDICAIDVLVKGNKYYVLENNSSPSLTNQVTQFYKKNIPGLIKKKYGFKIGKLK
jgi:glutathione synthase/RimK-type ligase-like ATP-grasp enzyme